MDYFCSVIFPKLIVVIIIIGAFLLGLYLGKYHEIKLRKKYIQNDLEKSASCILYIFFGNLRKTYFVNSDTKYCGRLEEIIARKEEELNHANHGTRLNDINNIAKKFIKELTTENAKVEIIRILGEKSFQNLEIQLASFKNSFFYDFVAIEDEEDIDDLDIINHYLSSLQKTEDACNEIVKIFESKKESKPSPP